VVSNLYRTTAAVRGHLERTVLAEHDLTWTGWVVLWVVWIWEEIEYRHVAVEAGIAKATLSGVAGTLERRGLVARRTHQADRRRALLRLTDEGAQLAEKLFPLFNAEESAVVACLSQREADLVAKALRKIVISLEDD
jgi:DNA-binding MarR family transcriptional regulator